MCRDLMLIIAIAFGFVSAAGAQTRVAAGGSVFLDVKRFSGDPANRTNDGEAIGGGVRLAAFVTPRWSLEVDVDLSRSTTTTSSNSISILTYTSTLTPGGSLPPGITPPPSITLPPGTTLPPSIYLPPALFETRTTTGLMSASALVGYRILGSGRVHPGFVGGLTFMRVRRVAESPYRFVLPAGIPNVVGGLLPSSLLERRTERIDYAPAATVGMEVALDVTSHLAIVPELRAHAFTTSGSVGAFAIRPGVAIRWIF